MFTSNADYITKLRSYFNNVLLVNRQNGYTSIETHLPYTGNASFHGGFVNEDNFMLGDRVTGFPYSMRNFQVSNAGVVSWLPVGYYDPQTFNYQLCSSSDNNKVTVLSTSISCSLPIYRTSDNTKPDDMRPTLIVTPKSSYRVAMQFFGSVGLILSTLAGIGVMAYWNHNALRLRQQIVLAFIIFALILASIKVLLSSMWIISEASCHVDYWLTHISFRVVNAALLFKLWRVHRIFNASGFKRVKITETRIVLNILYALAMCLVILALASGLGGSRIGHLRQIVDNQLHITYFCDIPLRSVSPIFHIILIVLQAFGMLGALWYAWKTKDVPPLVNEAPIIIPQLLLMLVVVIIAFSLLYVYNPNPIDYQFIVNMLYGISVCFSVPFYFGNLFMSLRRQEMKKKGGDDSTKSTLPTNASGFSTSSVAGEYESNNTQSLKDASDGIFKRHKLPSDVNMNLLHEDVAQELLRKAKSVDLKAKLCQEQIVYWRTQMLRVEELAEHNSDGTSRVTSYSSVYVTNDEDLPEVLASEAAEGATKSLTSSEA